MRPCRLFLQSSVKTLRLLCRILLKPCYCIDHCFDSSGIKISKRLSQTLASFKDKPLDSYLQVFMIFLWFVGAFLILSVLTGRDIGSFLTTLGALSAVLLFVFKDTILGFVASVQITVNDTVRIGTGSVCQTVMPMGMLSQSAFLLFRFKILTKPLPPSLPIS